MTNTALEEFFGERQLRYYFHHHPPSVPKNTSICRVRKFGFTLIGNPYPTPVDFSKVKQVQLANRFYGKDPDLNRLRSFVVPKDINTDGIHSNSSALAFQNKTIEPGQAFLVQTNTVGNGSITWHKNSKCEPKVSSNFRPADQIRSIDIMLSIICIDDTVIPADGALVEFDDAYCACVNYQDAPKLKH